MLKKAALSAALVMTTFAPAYGEVTAQPIPIDDFARIPNIQSISLSPEGSALSAIIALPGSNNEDTALATWDLDNPSAPPVVTPSGDRMKFLATTALGADSIFVIGRQEWTGRLAGCGEGRTTGSTATFVTKPYLTSVSQDDFEEAFASGGRTLGVSEATLRCFELAGTAGIVNTLPLDPEHVIINQTNQVSFQSNYYRYNLRTGQRELITSGGGGSAPALFSSRTGELLVRNEVQPSEGGDFEIRTLIKNQQTGEFEHHTALDTQIGDRYTVNLVGFTDDGQFAYVITNRFSDKAAVYLYDLNTREFDSEALMAHPDFDVSNIVFGNQPSNFGEVMGFTYLGLTPTTYWVDDQMNAIQTGLEAAFPDLEVSIMDYSDGYDIVLFSTESPSNPPTYYLLRNQSEVQQLGASRPWIESENVGEQSWVYYTARDGLQIPAILDLPAGWEEGDAPLPTIIHPHGGPWARDFGGWDASGWVPFFTSRGYAVLRPQYRGSDSVGRELWLAGDNEWGQAMQDDKDDGAAWLVEQGIADPDRIAIMGYSYGGFAAIAAVVRENSPYQCAIAGAGVSNLSRIQNNWSENFIQRVLQGRTLGGMDPMNNTDKANIPILLFHGDRDVRVPMFHSVDFYNAVRDQVPAQLVQIEDMPHSLPWYPRHFRTMLSAMETYLEEDCGPGGL